MPTKACYLLTFLILFSPLTSRFLLYCSCCLLFQRHRAANLPQKLFSHVLGLLYIGSPCFADCVVGDCVVGGRDVFDKDSRIIWTAAYSCLSGSQFGNSCVWRGCRVGAAVAGSYPEV